MKIYEMYMTISGRRIRGKPDDVPRKQREVDAGRDNQLADSVFQKRNRKAEDVRQDSIERKLDSGKYRFHGHHLKGCV